MDANGAGGIAGSTASGAAAGSAFGPWGTAIGAGVGLVAGITSYFGKQSAAKQRRREVEEEVRRMRLQQAQTLGLAEAVGAGSGFEYESDGLQKYLADMALEFRRQSEWALKTGKTDASNQSTAATLGLGTDIASVLFRYGQSSNWWKG